MDSASSQRSTLPRLGIGQSSPKVETECERLSKACHNVTKWADELHQVAMLLDVQVFFFDNNRFEHFQHLDEHERRWNEMAKSW